MGGHHDHVPASAAYRPRLLIVLGFTHPDFKGEIIEELKRLDAADTINVIDAIAVHKDADGNVTTEHLSTLDQDEAVEFGAKVAALVGLGAGGEETAMEFAEAGAEAAADGGIDVFADDEPWDVLGEIPPDTAAALVLIEHHWAVPLRDESAFPRPHPTIILPIRPPCLPRLPR